MDQYVSEFVQDKHIAVAGVSDRKFGGAIYKTMKKRGYQVYPVHPSRESFDNDRCFHSLASLPKQVKKVVIAISPDRAEAIIGEAAAAGITHLWFQQGKDFSRAAAMADQKGLRTVSGKCILMYAEPVTGIHAFHRFLAKLFRRL